MTSRQAKKAMKKFEAEVEKLVVKAKVPRADASSIEVHTAAASSTQGTTRRPILPEGEEDDEEETEKLFEEEYDGDVPKVLVGMKFPEKYRRAEGELPVWHSVLRNLAENLLEEGAKTSREILNLEKAELEMGAGNE